MEQIIKNIISIRKKKGITQEEIADRFGFSQNAIYRLEKGQRKLEVELLIFLCQLFEMSIDELINYHLDEEKKHLKSIAKEDAPAYIVQSEKVNYLNREIKLLNERLLDKETMLRMSTNLLNDKIEEIKRLNSYIEQLKQTK
jgi:transcriptional regulator with XRE-family HTH domain